MPPRVPMVPEAGRARSLVNISGPGWWSGRERLKAKPQHANLASLPAALRR